MPILVANKFYRYFWSLVFFGESLKSDSLRDHTVNTKFNVFYSTFTKVFFYSCHVFNVFNVFYFNHNVFLHLWLHLGIYKCSNLTSRHTFSPLLSRLVDYCKVIEVYAFFSLKIVCMYVCMLQERSQPHVWSGQGSVFGEGQGPTVGLSG